MSAIDVKEPEAAVISDRAVIHPTAKIGNNVSIGPYTVIGAHVEVGEGTRIDSHVSIDVNTKMGKNNKIYSYAAVGGEPQDLGYKGEPTVLIMGDNNVVREFVTINRGSTKGDGATRVGNNNCFLAYSHVAHDCIIGNYTQFVNNSTIAGHVQVDDFAILGAFTAVHQFCRIGAYAFLCRAAETSKDILPYLIAAGIPPVPRGLNTIGLKRNGFSSGKIKVLKAAYQIMFGHDVKIEEACEELLKLQEKYPDVKEVSGLVDFIKGSKRGVLRKIVPNSKLYEGR